jgi:ABC-2 type transport system permease protein
LNLRQLHLTLVFIKMFLRDRQSLFFSLFFPLIFLTAIGLVNDRGRGPIDISVVDRSAGDLSVRLVAALDAVFAVHTGDEAAMRARLIDGETTLVLIIPPEFNDTTTGADLTVLIDAGQVRLTGFILPALESALIDIERQFREVKPLFNLHVEDVKSRTQRYIDFLLPGILAFTLMQISIAGSGFNLVEYRRKGILKRLFVTPILPRDFIAAICIARLLLCLIQLSVLLVIAIVFMGVTIVGNLGYLYVVVVLGTVIFLCLGFCIGSIAKTQQAVGAIGNIVIFPQMFLAGVFFPIEAMPAMIQPVARLLPLSYVVTGLREIARACCRSTAA